MLAHRSAAPPSRGQADLRTALQMYGHSHATFEDLGTEMRRANPDNQTAEPDADHWEENGNEEILKYQDLIKLLKSEYQEKQRYNCT